MLLNYQNTISYRCFICEMPHLELISMFDFIGKKSKGFNCPSCGEENISVFNRKKVYNIKVKCVECGGEHIFSIKPEKFWNEGLMEYRCPLADTIILITGNRDEVEKHTEKAEQNYMTDAFGEEFLELEQTLIQNLENIFESVNAIHNLARAEKLTCKCKSHDISITTKDFCLLLTCDNCGVTDKILMSELEDIEYMKNMKNYILGQQSKQKTD